jgi:hypothetical protein
MNGWRPVWGSLSERTGSGYVPLGTTRDGVAEFVEHDCRPPRDSRERSWTCGCGRRWTRGWL